MLYIIVLGFVFGNAFKIVDLIDEHKWISGKIGFIMKYFFTLVVIGSVYFTIQYDVNFLLHFISIFLFWIFKNKMEYPSHVFIMFVSGILFGSKLDFVIQNLTIIGTILSFYFLLDFIAKRFKDTKILYLILYKRLGRFYLISLILSVYLGDYYILLHTVAGLLSMEGVRHMIKKGIIKVENP